MSTKSNPGRFNCYAAAFPDETIFTVLARDPAFPATVRFWASERVRLGKDETEDDRDRIAAAYEEAKSAEAWREANLDPFGDGTPTWRVPLGIDDDTSRPIRLTPEHEGDGTEAVRINRYWLHGLIERLESAPDMNDVRRVAELLSLARDSGLPTEFNGFNQPVVEEPERKVSASPALAAPYGGWDLREKIALGLGQVTRDMMATAKKMTEVHARLLLEFVDRINGYRLELDDRHPTRDIYREFAEGLGTMEKVLIDSAPHDLAHNPEVPPHRFSTFVKGERFAYARGLEIAPIHLPTALDAMAKDGWDLLAIFGQTDSEHVGFIFKRRLEANVVQRLAGSALSATDAMQADAILRRFRDSYPETGKVWRDSRPVAGERDQMEIELHVAGGSLANGHRIAFGVASMLSVISRDIGAFRATGLIEGCSKRAFEVTRDTDGNVSMDRVTTGEYVESGCPEFGRQQEP